MRLDGDMYESTWQALEALYPKLVVGWLLYRRRLRKPCIAGSTGRHDYRKANGITDPIIDIDGTGAYWRKMG